MKEFQYESQAEYVLMSQAGVRQYVYPRASAHNAIWDSRLTPDGRLFYALATEISTAGYVRLCEYDYRRNRPIQHFAVEDVILPNDRTIRASKFHTSISCLNDGRLIMTTHTTDKAPAHPTWLPYGYYNHNWEGFPGSNIVIYDPPTGQAENLGVPAPRESIYGATYDPKNNALWFMGWMRGHLYRYDLDAKRVVDYRQVTEQHSFRLVLGPDGNLYGSSLTGWVFKIDTDTRTVVDMRFRFPHTFTSYPCYYNTLSTARTGPDGRLYLAVMYDDHFYALDTKTGAFECLGAYKHTKGLARGESRCGVWGADFDSEGVFWYVVSALNDGSPPQFGLPSSLYRWDIARGGKPELLGVAGTRERTPSCVSDLFVDKRDGHDIMYLIGSNHGVDGPDITAVDLGEFRPHRPEAGGLAEDPFFGLDHPDYVTTMGELDRLEHLSRENSAAFDCKLDIPPIRLWRALAPDNIDDSCVGGIVWDRENVLHGICGKHKRFAFQIRNDGTLAAIAPVEDLAPDYLVWLQASAQPKPSTLGPGLPLPYYPGRQYKAVPAIDVEFADGRRIVGTTDGMLAILDADGKSVYSLGPAAPNGPIHAMTVTPDNKTLYGVAGDRDDLGYVFTYDDVHGLRWRGSLLAETNDHIGVAVSHELSCILISPDGKQLAIASGDRLGCVYLFTCDNFIRTDR